MKTQIKTTLYRGAGCLAMLATLASCSDDFLKQDPKSMLEPTTVYTSESGLRAALASCDRSYKDMLMDGNSHMMPIFSVLFMSDQGLYGKTDAGGAIMDDFANKLTPTSGMAGGGDSNAMQRFYDNTWTGIKYANTVLSYVDDVPGLDDDIRDEYKGRAYFHRAYKYYHLVLLFGDVPLVTKIIDRPKLNFRSTTKEAIFEMLVHDLEFAVQHVPSQRDMSVWGEVNQEACMQLLIKCYLATGRFKQAEDMATDLIENHGLALMQAPFGEFVPSGEPQTWLVTRNVLWDLHRGVNVCNGANTETILPLLNFHDENFTSYNIMRGSGMHWSNGDIKGPDGSDHPTYNYARNSKEYDVTNDWLRAMGRGIGCFRTSYHYNSTLWVQDGEMDWQDLRHNREVGNWIEPTDIRYNTPGQSWTGKNMQLYAEEDFKNSRGKVVVKKGQLLCLDTIRSWYPTPLFKQYILDQAAEENMGAVQFNGANKGDKCSNGNMYIFRLAETYLLRAEARFYQGRPADAAADVNVIRKRANAKKMFTTVTIGDIADERMRELYLEEWRQPELTRISWALAHSGQPDEWGNVYSLATWDKQSGTSLDGGSYWYQRCIHYNLFNRGQILSKVQLNYTVDKRNLFWPIPNSAITANFQTPLHQNYGYDGYSESIEVWDNWEDAVADEDVAGGSAGGVVVETEEE